jgi:hypothetical protein
MENSTLSTTSRFILRVLALNDQVPEELSRFLSVSMDFLSSSVAELMEAGTELVQQIPDGHLQLTQKGRSVYEKGGTFLRPRNLSFQISYDPLTKSVLDFDVERLVDKRRIRADGLFVIPARARPPRLAHLDLESVRAAARLDPRVKDTSEILEVTRIREVKLQYRTDILVAMLAGRVGDPETYVAFKGTMFAEDESDVLRNLNDKGFKLLPIEQKQDKLDAGSLSAVASTNEKEVLRSIDTLNHAVQQSDRQIAESVSELSSTASAEERREIQARLKTVESERDSDRKKVAELTAELERVNGGAAKIVITEDHRALLLRAANQAQNELIIVSGFVTPRATDKELIDAIAGAIQRGVTVWIAWGLAATQNNPDAYRHKEIGEKALRPLKYAIPKSLRDRLNVLMTRTHEKFIICDEQFCVSGSFNWLSYLGLRDSQYRRETSLYSERTEDISLWRVNAHHLFGTKST